MLGLRELPGPHSPREPRGIPVQGGPPSGQVSTEIVSLLRVFNGFKWVDKDLAIETEIHVQPGHLMIIPRAFNSIKFERVVPKIAFFKEDFLHTSSQEGDDKPHGG